MASLEVHGAKFAHHRIMREAETQNCRKPGASHHIITPFRAPLPSPRSLEPMARLTLVLDEDHIQFLRQAYSLPLIASQSRLLGSHKPSQNRAYEERFSGVSLAALAPNDW